MAATGRLGQPLQLNLVEPGFWENEKTLRNALYELLKAYELARDVNHDVWEFAVRIQELRRLYGLSESVLRWLVYKQVVAHAAETTRADDESRSFSPLKRWQFKRRTCFVLTEFGRAFAQQLLTCTVPEEVQLPGLCDSDRNEPLHRPRWDIARHELRVAGYLVKQFRWPACNQETVLNALEEERWPQEGIYDPLPPQDHAVPKQRLRDTIKCLNRYQKHRFVHFRCDGTGERILWEFTPKAVEVLEAHRRARNSPLTR